MLSLHRMIEQGCLLLLLFCSGCQATPTATVVGQVSAVQPLTGELAPVRSGTVNFHLGLQGRPRSADLHADGSFTLSDLSAGEWIVTVESPWLGPLDNPALGPSQDGVWFPLHPVYGNLATTPLRCTVHSGTQTIHLKLDRSPATRN